MRENRLIPCGMLGQVRRLSTPAPNLSAEIRKNICGNTFKKPPICARIRKSGGGGCVFRRPGFPWLSDYSFAPAALSSAATSFSVAYLSAVMPFRSREKNSAFQNWNSLPNAKLETNDRRIAPVFTANLPCGLNHPKRAIGFVLQLCAGFYEYFRRAFRLVDCRIH